MGFQAHSKASKLVRVLIDSPTQVGTLMLGHYLLVSTHPGLELEAEDVLHSLGLSSGDLFVISLVSEVLFNCTLDVDLALDGAGAKIFVSFYDHIIVMLFEVAEQTVLVVAEVGRCRLVEALLDLFVFSFEVVDGIFDGDVSLIECCARLDVELGIVVIVAPFRLVVSKECYASDIVAETFEGLFSLVGGAVVLDTVVEAEA